MAQEPNKNDTLEEQTPTQQVHWAGSVPYVPDTAKGGGLANARDRSGNS